MRAAGRRRAGPSPAVRWSRSERRRARRRDRFLRKEVYAPRWWSLAVFSCGATPGARHLRIAALPEPHDKIPRMQIAVAQLNQVIGDLGGNAAAILDATRAASREGARLVVTPELSL